MGNSIFIHEFTAMACLCQITLGGISRDKALALAALAEKEVRRIEHKYSRYRNDSILTTINRQAGIAPVECDEETLSLLDKADLLHQYSDGLFDISSGVLRRAWQFDKATPPDSALIEKTLLLVGWEKVQRNRNSVYLPLAGMEIDFGGFGKEYAADCAALLTLAQGATSGYINLGGDMRVLGPKPNGEPWNIGIRHPRRDDLPIATIPLSIGALATSGDYERYFDYEGRRYCHVLNPKTGQPAQSWQSISVISHDTLSAGSLCTIAMLMEEDGLAFLQGANVDFLAVSRTGEVFSECREEVALYAHA